MRLPDLSQLVPTGQNNEIAAPMMSTYDDVKSVYLPPSIISNGVSATKLRIANIMSSRNMLKDDGVAITSPSDRGTSSTSL